MKVGTFLLAKNFADRRGSRMGQLTGDICSVKRGVVWPGAELWGVHSGGKGGGDGLGEVCSSR